MKVNIYINGQPVETYSEAELNRIKRALTVKAMTAVGYIPAEGSIKCHEKTNAGNLPA
jgi:hypothetical protein